MAATLGVSQGMTGVVFDVRSAFLSGLPLDREVYCRAPAAGLPAAAGLPDIRPYQLLRVLKGASGLTEAPRLWYLRARQLLEGAGSWNCGARTPCSTSAQVACASPCWSCTSTTSCCSAWPSTPASVRKARQYIDRVFNIN